MTSSPVTLRAVLVVVQGMTAGQTYVVRRHCVIGRDEDADLRLPDLAISRHHALIVVDPDGTVSLRDLGSSNGTRVNGQRLASERPLTDGDEIAIGASTVLKFTCEPANDFSPTKGVPSGTEPPASA